MTRVYAVILAAVLLLAGCGAGQDPYRVDTVVRIPLDGSGEETVPTLPEPETFPPLVFPELEGVPEFTLPGDVQVQENRKPTGTQKNEETRDKQTHSVSGTATEVPPAVASEPGAPEVRGADILAAVNEIRTAEGLPALAWDADLAELATVRWEELSRLWSHTRPDGRGYATVADNTSWEGRLTAELAGYAFGGESWRAVVTDWANSGSHRAALLDRESTAAGVCVRRTGDELRLCMLLGKQ